MESFSGILNNAQEHFQDYQTRAEARNDIFSYMEGFYKRRRRNSSLGYLSPDDFERQHFAVLN